jgi:hypothetical protein
MDYSKIIDLTFGHLAKRRYIPIGLKKIVKCEYYKGYRIVFIEDTIYRCSIHNTVPIVNDLNEIP